MQLSTRQTRIFRLAILLGAGYPVSSKKIITELACSEPTLTRALKELRESYSAEIRYSRSSHSYQLVDPGQLDQKILFRMHEVLADSENTRADETVHKVTLDKEKKKAVSLSLRMSVLSKIDKFSNLADMTRSDAVELLVDRCIAELSAAYKQHGMPR